MLEAFDFKSPNFLAFLAGLLAVVAAAGYSLWAGIGSIDPMSARISYVSLAGAAVILVAYVMHHRNKHKPAPLADQ